MKELLNLEVIPVRAKKFQLINGIDIEPYGLDLLIAKTLTNCEAKRKRFNN